MDYYERWERCESAADESVFEPTESREDAEREAWEYFENTARRPDQWDDPERYEVPIPSLLPSEREARRRADDLERIAQLISDEAQADAERSLRVWLLGLPPEAGGPSAGPGGKAA